MEISVVVVLIGLLAALGLPALRRVSLKSKATAVVNDFRAYSGAFVTYNLQRGAWPAEAAAGAIPTEVADAVRDSFTKPSPIGGHYDWDNDVSANGFHTTAAISIVTTGDSAIVDDLDLLELIDQLADDGNLSTGNIRLGATNALVYIIEQ